MLKKSDSSQGMSGVSSGIDPHIRIILFDAVGTVMYPQPGIAQAYVDIGRRFIKGLDEAHVLSRFKRVFSTVFSAETAQTPVTEESTVLAWKQVVEGTFPDFEDAGGELFQQLWDHFAAPDSWGVYDDVDSCFERLLEAGYELGIASNFDSRLEGIVRANATLSRVQHVFHSAQLGWNKPARGFCDGITSRLGVAADQIVLIGDRLDNDIQPALQAGWQGIWLDRLDEYSAGEAHDGARVKRITSLAGLSWIELD